MIFSLCNNNSKKSVVLSWQSSWTIVKFNLNDKKRMGLIHHRDQSSLIQLSILFLNLWTKCPWCVILQKALKLCSSGKHIKLRLQSFDFVCYYQIVMQIMNVRLCVEKLHGNR